MRRRGVGHASASDLKPAPTLPIASSTLRRSRVERCQPVEARHQQHVAFAQHAQRPPERRPVRDNVAHLLGKTFAALASFSDASCAASVCPYVLTLA
jgi:hypothetical protein